MEYKLLKIKDLRELLDKPEFWQQEELPIPRTRALSLVNNPRAEDDDYALFYAQENGKTIGFLGFLPDKIFIDDTGKKFYWLSTWWASKKYSGVGIILMNKALKDCPYPYGVSDFTIDAGHVYDKLKMFDNLQILDGRKFYCSFNLHKIIPHKKPKFKSLTPLIRIFDKLFGAIHNIFKWVWYKRIALPDGYEIKRVNEIDDEMAEFINKHNNAELTMRSDEELRWMMEYPWIREDNEEQKRYRFLCSAEKFSYDLNKIYYNDELVAVILLKYVDGNLEAPYVYFHHEHRSIIGLFIGRRIIEMKAEMFLSFNPAVINPLINSDFPFLTIRQEIRRLIISKKREGIEIEKSLIQDGDGDRGFA